MMLRSFFRARLEFRGSLLLLILSLGLLFIQGVHSFANVTLGTYNIDPKSITVSGVSSGGYMAVQMHIAFSSIIKGAGITAGGPFYCANDNIAVALSSCMKDPGLISTTELVTITYTTAASKFIDDLKNLAGSRVYLFSGTKDSVVHPGVVQKLEEYYSHFISDQNILSKYDFPAEHAWITNNFGNDCSYLGSPYINNCNYDLGYDVLNHLYGNITKSRIPDNGNIVSFGQAEFLPGIWTLKDVSMGSTGYLYVPSACQQGGLCRLHIALHGCEQDEESIGTDFVEHAGLNGYAESNNIIVLYPQTQSNALNPKSCWDWWGFTGPNYASNSGLQMVTLKNMINRLVYGS